VVNENNILHIGFGKEEERGRVRSTIKEERKGLSALFLAGVEEV